MNPIVLFFRLNENKLKEEKEVKQKKCHLLTSDWVPGKLQNGPTVRTSQRKLKIRTAPSTRSPFNCNARKDPIARAARSVNTTPARYSNFFHKLAGWNFGRSCSAYFFVTTTDNCKEELPCVPILACATGHFLYKHLVVELFDCA